MSKELKDLYKIGHTCCLNSSDIKYGIIDDDPEDRDCKDMEEMVECLNNVEEGLKRLEQLEKPKEIVGTTTVDKALEQFLINSCPEVKKKLDILNILLKYAELVDDEHGYGITIKGLYTFKNISKEEYELLKEVLPNV